MTKKKKKQPHQLFRYAWVAQAVKWSALGFSSRPDRRVMSWSTAQGSVPGAESAWRLSPSHSAPPPSSLSKINTLKKCFLS